MYDNERELEEKITEIVDQMGYLLMDVILISLKKINTENQTLKELFDIRMEELREDRYYSFGETESGYPGEET